MIAAVVERCAGIDVGKKEVVVTVLTGPLPEEPERETRTFSTMLAGLEDLRGWLLAKACTCVIMESTGVYWQPVKNILEESVAIVLANAEDVKARKGHKTDPEDSWWLAHLLRHGMVRGSFLPPRAVEQLRDLTRRRKKLLSNAGGERNRIQKILERANIKIGSVISDVFGITGQRILQALLEQQTVPATALAELAKGRARTKIPELTASLEGHRLNGHDRWIIRQCVEHLSFLESQLREIEQELLRQLQPWAEDYALLQSIPGIKEDVAAAVIAETGGDMSQFPSDKNITSWAGYAPANHISAGKHKHRGRRRGNKFLRGALAQAVQAAAKKRDSSLQAQFYRLQRRIGKPKAMVALGRKLLVVIYHVLQTRQPYSELDPAERRKQEREHQIEHHLRRLRQLGVVLPGITPETTLVTPQRLRRKRAHTPGPLGFHAR
jgi:transposase